MADLVLISCKLVWDSLDDYRDVLADRGIEVDVPRFDGQQLEEADLLPIIDRYDGILAGDDILNRAVLERAKKLRVISKWGIGIDAIDLEAAGERSIRVFNTPGVFGEELGDYALGYLLMLARRQHDVDRRVRAGEWPKIRGTSLAGRTLGIIGLGSSGRAFARRATAVGMHVIGFDPVVPEPPIDDCRLVDLDTLFAEADVISLNAPANAQTRQIVNRASLARMKPGVWLINISRGSLIEEAALIDALATGHVAAAALDVFEEEPLRNDHPLTAIPNVILGSHNGSNTAEAVARTTELAIGNLIRGLDEAR